MKTPCDQLDRVAEYAMRAVPVDERPAFETHVNECVACRQELESLRDVVGAFVDWPVDILRPASPQWNRLAERIGIGAGADESTWPQAPAWIAVAPGISTKLLATDHAKGCVSMLVRLAPGTTYPAHAHAGTEELHLLDGELWIDDRKLCPGDFNRAEPGTADQRVWSETGCTCVLVTSIHDVLA